MQSLPTSGLAMPGSFFAQQCGPALLFDLDGALVDANPPASQFLASRPARGTPEILEQLRSYTGASTAQGPGARPASPVVTVDPAGIVHTYQCFALPLFAADGQSAGTLLHLHELHEVPAAASPLAPAPPLQSTFAGMEEQVHLILEATCANAWDWDLTTGTVYFSDQWLASLGYTREEIAPTAAFWQSIVHPEDWLRVEATLNAYFAGGSPVYACENRLRMRSGDYRPNLDQGKVVAWDASGRPLRMIGIDIDITAQKRAEAERAAAVQRLVMATEVAGVGIWEFDAATHLLTWNERMYALYGFPPGEPITETRWLAMIHPDDLLALQDQRQLTLATGKPTAMEFRITLPDGTPRHLYGIRGTTRDAAGHITGMIGVSIDITARLEVQTQLRDSLQRLRLAASAADIGIWTWNIADGRLDWDARMCAIYGIPENADDTISYFDAWRTRIYPGDVSITDIQGDGLSQFNPRWDGTYRIVLPDGEVRHIYASCVVEYDDRGEPVRMIGVNRDITAQKQYEHLLQDTNAELERRVAARTVELQDTVAELQRANSAKDAFLAAVSHELRTPMTGIIGMAEALESQSRGPLNEQQLHYLGTLHASAQRLLEMINDVLGYASVVSENRPPVRETCHLAELCAISTRRARVKAAQKDQMVDLQIEPFDLTLVSDGDMLVKILETLLDNAVKFTPAHGRIGVAIARRRKTVEFTVWDTGIGIEEEQLPRLFQPLTQIDWQLSRRYGGIGLGLAYVQRMVEILGGTIHVESAAGAGSRFTVTLPCDAEATR